MLLLVDGDDILININAMRFFVNLLHNKILTSNRWNYGLIFFLVLFLMFFFCMVELAFWFFYFIFINRFFINFDADVLIDILWFGV